MDLIVQAIAIVIATLAVVLLTGASLGFEGPDSASVRSYVEGFAVVELFTSQGCSSCPSADQFLSELLQESEKESKAVYALSFHVDYWNRLGWKDPYSNGSFTDRQRKYARALGTSQIYTPQMIVNGEEAFVGSQREIGRSLVAQTLQKKASSKIEALSLEREGSNLRINGHFSGNYSESVVNFALVERDISTEVTRGENEGRTLHHDNVVRIFKSTEMSSAGKAQTHITIPQELDESKAMVIVFVQEVPSMKILCAGSLPFNNL